MSISLVLVARVTVVCAVALLTTVAAMVSVLVPTVARFRIGSSCTNREDRTKHSE